MCGANNCSAQTRGRLYRDLGVVLVAGMNRADDGKKAFADALKADPNVALEKDLTTPEVDAAFQAAKGGGSAPPTPPPPKAPAASGDMVHTPPAEQAVLTPVPIYVEVPESLNVAKVVLRYKAFGTTDWKTLELKKMTGGYGGEVPCQEVGSTTGDLSYYIQATDAGGDVVSTTGSRNAPNKVAIKNELAGEAPHLPGKPAPAQCRDKADCPPGFPGCTPGKKRSGANKSWATRARRTWSAAKGSRARTGSAKPATRPTPTIPSRKRRAIRAPTAARVRPAAPTRSARGRRAG